MSGFTAMQCGACGVEFHMPTALYDECRKEKNKTWHCPNGHPRCFRESDTDTLRRERDLLKQQLAQKEDEAREAVEAEKKERRKLERKLRRVQKGVCPHCTRSFMNLQAHMATKHSALSCGGEPAPAKLKVVK